MEYDNILKQIGEFGPFQRRVYFILCLVYLPTAFNTMGYVFWAARLDHWCHVDRTSDFANISKELWKNWTIPVKLDSGGHLQYESCLQYSSADNATLLSQYVKSETMDPVNMITHKNWTWWQGDNTQVKACQSWDYDTNQYKSSIVTKYSLVCDRQWMISMTQSVYLACTMFGAVGAGLLSDKFGRRPVLLLSVLFQFMASFAIAFAPNVYIFIVFRGLCATFSNASSQSAYVMLIELVGPSWRVFAGIGFMLAWATFYMLIPLLAYFIRDHFILMLVFSLPGTIVILLYWVIPESPRWLMINKRQTEATSLIKHMAQSNRHMFIEEEGFDIVFEIKEQEKMEGDTKISSIFRSPNFWKITLVQCFLWCTIAGVYYGLSVNPNTLGGNDYLNVFISGTVEVPGYLWGHVTFVHFGRRLPLTLMTILAGTSLFVIVWVPAGLYAVSVTLVSVGKFAVTCTFGMLYIYTSELYPTSIRGVTLGICSASARVGSALAPFAADLSVYYPGAPFIIFGTMTLVASVLVLTLPETKGISLPQTMEDGRRLAQQPSAFTRCLKMCSTDKTSDKKTRKNHKESVL